MTMLSVPLEVTLSQTSKFPAIKPSSTESKSFPFGVVSAKDPATVMSAILVDDPLSSEREETISNF